MLKKILLVIATVVLLVGVGGAGRSNQGRIPWKDPAPIASAAAEQKILDVLADIYLNQRRGMMNVQPEDGRVLRLLTEAVGAKHVVEIGTSNGYSGILPCIANDRRQADHP